MSRDQLRVDLLERDVQTREERQRVEHEDGQALGDLRGLGHGGHQQSKSDRCGGCEHERDQGHEVPAGVVRERQSVRAGPGAEQDADPDHGQDQGHGRLRGQEPGRGHGRGRHPAQNALLAVRRELLGKSRQTHRDEHEHHQRRHVQVEERDATERLVGAGRRRDAAEDHQQRKRDADGYDQPDRAADGDLDLTGDEQAKRPSLSGGEAEGRGAHRVAPFVS